MQYRSRKNPEHTCEAEQYRPGEPYPVGVGEFPFPSARYQGAWIGSFDRGRIVPDWSWIVRSGERVQVLSDGEFQRRWEAS